MKTITNYIKINYLLIILLVILIAVDVFTHISSCVITHESIVLTFVGTLATFVVVSNYAQVKDIEKKMEERIQKLEVNLLEVKTIKDDMERKSNQFEEEVSVKMYLIGDVFKSECRDANKLAVEPPEHRPGFYFKKLSEKFPKMTGEQLRKLIEIYLVQP